MSSPLSSPVPNPALRLAPARTRPVRRHWLVTSVGLHLVLGALTAIVVTNARLPEPPPSFEVELAAADAPPPTPSEATAASVPGTPFPTDALPDSPPPSPDSAPVVPPDPRPPVITEAPPPKPTDPPPPADATPPPPPQPMQEMALLDPPPFPPPRLPPEPVTPIVTPAPPAPEPKLPARLTPPVRTAPVSKLVPHREAAARPVAGPPASIDAPAKPAEPATPQPGWEQLLASWLAAHRTYPEAARRRGDTGDVTLRLAIAPDGHVTEVIIVASTASQQLNDAAVAIFTGAILPPPQAPVIRSVRIRYRLED